MSNQSIILMFVSVGSIIGGFVPDLWGAGFLSLWSIVFSAIGGFVGIWLAYKFINS